MSTTAQISGLFSKEHTALVVLIGFCLYGTWSNHLELIELKVQNAKTLTKLETLLKDENPKQLAASDAYRQERKAKFETFTIASFSPFHNGSDHRENGYRIYQAIGLLNRRNRWLCGC
ncbi:hypothetical protein L3073_06015 [Ancylomarina sp. DW003]|nr:hypothetical protein [Ancylomarina sp. DW003]MDE5421756.1 hypothetical protein [Ancylomarina sp. DW003]